MIRELAWAQLLGLVLTIPVAALLPWSIGLIAGDPGMTFRKSVSSMRRRWIWALLLMFGCLVPATVLHYLLNYMAIGMPAPVVALLLLLDSVLVGLIALLMGCCYWSIYRFRVLASQPSSNVNAEIPG